MIIKKLGIISALLLCTSNYAFASCDTQDSSLSEVTKTRQTPSIPFSDIVREKRANQKEFLELYSNPSNNQDSGSLIMLLLSCSDQSSPEFLDLKAQILAQEKSRKEASLRQSYLIERNEYLEKIAFEPLLDLHRKKEDNHSQKAESIQYVTQDKDSFFFKEEIIGSQKIIQVPYNVPNTASQNFYTLYNANRNLWVGFELLSTDNISWWRERLGWEATMQFGKYCKDDFKEKFMFLSDVHSEIPIETAIQQAFFPEGFSGLDFGRPSPSIKFINELDCMSLRSSSLEESSAQFQSAYEAYSPSEDQHVNYLAAFRGFKMNLDRYTQVPTWVAYISSEKLEAPFSKNMPVTSASLKHAMTVTVELPFYSPLGIFASPIARAVDTEPCTQASMLLQSGVAQLLGEIDPKIKIGITRPLGNVSNIFSRSGLKFSSTFGNSLPKDMTPTILREGFYELTEDETIQFHTHGYTPFVFFDPRTKEVYQVSNKNPFSTNYYLGGIPLHDMKLPFTVFDREELANISK